MTVDSSSIHEGDELPLLHIQPSLGMVIRFCALQWTFPVFFYDADAARAAGLKLEVRLEVDIGFARTGIAGDGALGLARAVSRLRGLDLKKSPSVAETVDWAKALVMLNADSLDRETLENTLTVLLKQESDVQKASRAQTGGGGRQGGQGHFGADGRGRRTGSLEMRGSPLRHVKPVPHRALSLLHI